MKTAKWAWGEGMALSHGSSFTVQLHPIWAMAVDFLCLVVKEGDRGGLREEGKKLYLAGAGCQEQPTHGYQMCLCGGPWLTRWPHSLIELALPSRMRPMRPAWGWMVGAWFLSAAISVSSLESSRYAEHFPVGQCQAEPMALVPWSFQPWTRRLLS